MCQIFVSSPSRTFLRKADDLRSLLQHLVAHRVSIEVGDLHPPVLPQLPSVELPQRRHHCSLRERVRDVGPLSHLQPAQDVSLDRLKEVHVQLARLGVLRLSESTGRAGIPGRRVRLLLGPGCSGAADREDASHEECQSKKTAIHFLFEEEGENNFFPIFSEFRSYKET